MCKSFVEKVQYLLDNSIPPKKIARIIGTPIINAEAIEAGEWDEIHERPTEAFKLLHMAKKVGMIQELIAVGKSSKEITKAVSVSLTTVEAVRADEWDEANGRPNQIWLTTYKQRRRNAEIRRLRARLAELASEGGQLCPLG